MRSAAPVRTNVSAPVRIEASAPVYALPTWSPSAPVYEAPRVVPERIVSAPAPEWGISPGIGAWDDSHHWGYVEPANWGHWRGN